MIFYWSCFLSCCEFSASLKIANFIPPKEKSVVFGSDGILRSITFWEGRPVWKISFFFFMRVGKIKILQLLIFLLLPINPARVQPIFSSWEKPVEVIQFGGRRHRAVGTDIQKGQVVGERDFTVDVCHVTMRGNKRDRVARPLAGNRVGERLPSSHTKHTSSGARMVMWLVGTLKYLFRITIRLGKTPQSSCQQRGW